MIKSLEHLEASLLDAFYRLSKASNPWAITYGPAAALVCTTQRLGWKVRSAEQI